MNAELALGVGQILCTGTIVQSIKDSNPTITFSLGTIEIQFDESPAGQAIEDIGHNRIRIRIGGSDQYSYYAVRYENGIKFGPVEIVLNLAIFYLNTVEPMRVIHYTIFEDS